MADILTCRWQFNFHFIWTSRPSPSLLLLWNKLSGWPFRYVTSHPGQLSLAIPPWVGAMNTSESWGVNRHTARYAGPVSMVSQSKNWCLAEGLRKQRSASPYGP